MIRRSTLVIAVLVLAAALCPASLGADQISQKFEWKPVNGIQDIEVEVTRIKVSQITFDLGSTLSSTPVRRSTAKAKCRVDNNGFINAEVGIAVVVFDEEGNVVAAGSGGTKWGYLTKGDRSYYTVDFPYVYRNMEKAKSFLVTLETKEKGRDEKKKESPTPAPKN